MTRSSRRRLAGRTVGGSALGVACVALLAPPAGATATSGVVFNEQITLNNGQVVNACQESIIADVADFKSFAYAKQPSGSSCGTAVSVPAGYLGAYLNGYRNGAYCGQIAPAYSPGAGSYFGVGGAICTNPSGLQSFFTNGYAMFYKGPSYQYNNGYKVYFRQSPSQSY